MGFQGIDGFGQKRNRAAVRAIMRHSAKDGRLAAAKAKRERRSARRASGEKVITFLRWPAGGIDTTTPDGTYIQGGEGFPNGGFQIVIVGDLQGAVDDYRAAVAAWQGNPMRQVSCSAMTLVAPLAATQSARPFLNIIVEPES